MTGLARVPRGPAPDPAAQTPHQQREGRMADEPPAPAARPVDAEALYRAHVRPLYTFIYSRVGNRESAEDLTSAVFIKALTYLNPTCEEQSRVAWLYRVARNAVADYWRAGRGAHALALEEVRPARQAPPAADVGREELTAARARALLARLPENYRTVLSHRLLEGLSVAETARCMGTSEGNVKILQHRALKRAAELREDDTVDG
jgi:RNA polymerase sigma-70 factor, ECF subfamily